MATPVRILVVDDNSDMAQATRRLLEGAGYAVEVALTAATAWQAVQAVPPDLILLDRDLTKEDGLELCRRIKAAPAFAGIFVILISGTSTRTEELADGLDSGADGHIVLPIADRELLARLEAFVRILRLTRSLHDGERRYRELVENANSAIIRRQAALVELGEFALCGVEIPVLFERTVGRLAEVLDVEMCKVLELLPDRSALLLRAGVGWQPGLVGQATVPLGLDSQAGFTLQAKEPVIVPDLRSETRFHGPPLLHEHGAVSGMSTIIGVPERPFGVLGVHTTRTRTFDVHDVHLLQGVANVLGHAVQRQTHAAEIDRLNRLYATISQVNQAIVRSHDRSRLCQRSAG